MPGGSIRARLIGGTTIWLLVAFAIGGVALSSAFRRSVEAAFVQRLDSLLLAVIAALDVPPTGDVRLARDIPNPDFDRVYSGWYWQVTDGDVRLASRSLWDFDLAIGPDAAVPATSRVIPGPQQEPLRVVSRRLRYPSHPQPITVAVAGPEGELRRDIAAFDRLLLLSLAGLALALLAAVAVQVGYGLRPFRRLRSELDAIRSGRRTRLTGGYPREIEPLVDTMNVVLDEDARRIDRARALSGNLAHGLKTPLSVLAVEAARAAPDGTRIAAQVSRMTAVIDHHLARAAAAGAQQPIGARTAIRAVVSDLRAMLLRIHADRGLTIDMEVPDDLRFAGERQDLEEMLGNLIDNACKWATSRVSVSAARAGDVIEIAVDDDGPGLVSAQAAAALQRGVRLDADTPGSGLGLSITSDLARLYRGSLTLGRGPLSGMRATLRLPGY
jgi:signal transduction histidine kinase